MGCVSSKKAATRSLPSSPDIVFSSAAPSDNNWIRNSSSRSKGKPGNASGTLEKIKEEPRKDTDEVSVPNNNRLESRQLKKGTSSGKSSSFSLRFRRLTDGEHVAAGWPAWLSVVAGEAVDGWLPLRSDSYEKFEKIGQGTYSSVYRARDTETGKMVALKKVRFDNFKPESVRFMAREITILRRLDHPNIMKLEGIITSRLSCNIYLVFEYMEHDLTGLLSSPDIKFAEVQIKCYMRQLLCGIEHCHAQGIMHRDVKTSNILVNNEGVLKIADFGLANFNTGNNGEPLTSRVVTLWYRPPELLLGSTNYEESVDLWSVGCVFAELFKGKPLLKGRTEVEQLHKIFKLCGSPPDEYWRKTKLPLATLFKPQHHYQSTLRERCKEFPKTAVDLIESFLYIEPYKRMTASSALDSEYFSSRPCACDPSSLPKYPPNKEIDAHSREDARRRKVGSRMRASGTSRKVRKPLQESTQEETNISFVRRSNGDHTQVKGKGAIKSIGSSLPYDTKSEVSQVSQVTEMSQADSIRSVPVITASSGYASDKRQRQGSASSRLHTKRTSSAIDPTSVLYANNTVCSNRQDTISSRGRDAYMKHAMPRQQSHPYWRDLYDSPDSCLSQDSSVDYNDQNARGTLSGPLIESGSNSGIQERYARQAVQKSRFYRGV